MSSCLRYANENVTKQWDPCAIRTANLNVNFTKKKCALYTGKYGTLNIQYRLGVVFKVASITADTSDYSEAGKIRNMIAVTG